MAHRMVTCKSCNAVLDVGDELRALVVYCPQTGKSIADVKMWGSAKSRVECKTDPDDEKEPSHYLQLDPPESVEEELERLTRETAAMSTAVFQEPYPTHAPNYGSDP